MANQRDLLVRFLGDSKGLTRAAKDAISSLDDTASASDKVAAALSAMAEDMRAEMKGATGAADALASAMGDELVAEIKAAGGSVDRFVSDLHRAGLTYDEIIAGSDQLATSIKEVGDAAKLMGGEVEDGAKRADDGLRRVNDSGDQSRSVFANLIGNSAQDLGELGGVAGTAGVALGQLAEYAADGNIKLSNLAGFVGPMAAVGVAVAGISWAMGKLKEESENAAEEAKLMLGVQEKLRDGKFDDAAADLAESYKDTVEAMASMGVPAREVLAFITGASDQMPTFNQLLEENKVTFEEGGTGLTDFGMKLNDLSGKVYGAADAFKTQRDVLTGTDEMTQMFAASLRDAADAASATAPAIARVDRSAQDYADEVRRAEDATRALDDAYRNLTGQLDQQDAWDNFLTTMYEFRSATDRTEAETRDYIRSLADTVTAMDNVPDEKKVELLAQLDEGDIAVVEAYITEWGKGIDVPVRFKGQGSVGFEKRATGGPVNAGQPYLVGEKGPEIVVPGRSGTVIPNHRIGGSSGSAVGGSISVAIYPKTLPTDRELIDLVTNLRRRNGNVI